MMNPDSIENETIRLALLGVKPSGPVGKRRKRNKYRHMIFAIARKENGQGLPNGTISLKETDMQRREAQIDGPVWTGDCPGKDVLERHAVRLLCKFAFDVLRMEEIVVHASKDDAIFAVYKSCGFVSTGTTLKGEGQFIFEMRLCPG